MLTNVLCWIGGLTAYGMFQRDGYPCRLEVTAVVDCSVRQSVVMDCGFEVLCGKKCDSYAR